MRQARLLHSTRWTALVFHCDRRERVFERDIFRLGTATTSSPSTFLVVIADAHDYDSSQASRSVRNRSVSAAHRGSIVSCR